MAYLIDTDWTIDRLAEVPDAVRLLDRLAAEGIAISVVTCMEMYQGILQEHGPRNRQAQVRRHALVRPAPPSFEGGRAPLRGPA